MIRGDVTGSVRGFSTRWTSDSGAIREFAAGARRAYEGYGCESALDLGERGVDTCLLISREDQLVGGFAVRAIDPVERRMLLKAGAGVIEAIAAWVDPDYRFVDDVTVADIIAANSLIALGHCGAAVMVCDSADHSTGRWVRAGARPLTPYSSRAYPAPGYSTVPLVFELDELGLRMDRQLLMLAVEQISTQTGWETAAAMLRMALPQLPRTNSRMEVDEGE